LRIAALTLLLTLGLGAVASHAQPTALSQARRAFKTRVHPKPKRGAPADAAPPEVFNTITYPAAPGKLKAYVTPDPKTGRKHAAIIWITGGDCNSIGDVWTPASPDNDQTAAAYRQAGIVMMFPSLRGGNDNPGTKQGFLGEVEDILSAAKWLEKQPYVNPNRIYLGGHSTGGTLAMLVAESSARFRNVFAFGPVGDVAGYGANSNFLPFDIRDDGEVAVRSPIYWLSSVKSPLWVIEGTRESNIESLHEMEKANTNRNIRFLAVAGANHFNVLAPINKLIAQKIRNDFGARTNIKLTETELNQAYAKK
jgi:dipeptidyl aminopeptidase/acylaminoacyl peptidase